MNNRSRKSIINTMTIGTLIAVFGSCAHAQNAPKVAEDLALTPAQAGMMSSVNPIKRDKAIVYKQVFSDGRVVYGDEPVKGHAVTKIIDVDLRSTPTWAAKTDASNDSPSLQTPVASNSPVTEVDEKAANVLAAHKKARSTAAARLIAAEEQFKRANDLLQNAETPLAGERSMNVNGTSRLNATYFERQENAKSAAQLAALEYDAALNGARNAN
jgi:hypothetical protein